MFISYAKEVESYLSESKEYLTEKTCLFNH